jgi:hypothetical protein
LAQAADSGAGEGAEEAALEPSSVLVLALEVNVAREFRGPVLIALEHLKKLKICLKKKGKSPKN